MNPSASTVPLSYLARINFVMDIFLGIYLFALYNQNTTALSSLGVVVPLLCFGLKALLLFDPVRWWAGLSEWFGQWRSHRLLLVMFAVFASLMLISCFYSPRFAYSLREYRHGVGLAVVLAILFADRLSDPVGVKRVWYAVLGSAVYLMGLQVFNWVLLASDAGELLPRYDDFPYRSFATADVFFMPFVLFSGIAFPQVWRKNGGRLAWFIAVLALLVLVLSTSARGAWLAMAVTILGFVCWQRGRARGLIALGVLVVGLFLWWVHVFVPDNPVSMRIAQGLDTSRRANHGTWSAAWDLFLESPWLGYGYGKEIFHQVYANRVAAYPDWFFNVSLGPHSKYLDSACAAGIFACFSLIGLYLVALRDGIRLAAQLYEPKARALAQAALLGLVSVMMVHGFVESLRWQPMGVFLGILWGLSRGMSPQGVKRG